jgi:membrane protein DedA with SNARE-associated domain
MDSEILDWIIRYGYLFMFLVLLVEGPVVTASGALASALGYFNVYVVFALSFLANFLPDVLYYGLGWWSGQWVLDRYGERLGIPRGRRGRAAVFIGSNVVKWLLLVKTVPFVSPPGLAVMGALGVPLRRFIWWDATVVALTSLGFVLLGYYSGKGYEELRRLTQYGTIGLLGIFLAFILSAFLWGRIARKLSGRMQRFTAEERPAQK